MGEQPRHGLAARAAARAAARFLKVQWTRAAASDLARVHEHLAAVAPVAAARVVGELARAPRRLLEHPRLGERLDAYAPREVRRVIVGDYEVRYELDNATIYILRLWHTREHRPLAPSE